MPEESDAGDERAGEVAALLVRVYEIHEVVVAETGGLPGLREARLLHAAVARPFATFEGRDLYSTDFDKAAALFHSLIKSHPFLDGTKRTALASALYFLEQSGHTLPQWLPLDHVVDFCVAVAEENMRIAAGELTQSRTVADIADWFRDLLGEHS
jgi:death-on-curing protein